MTESIYKEYQNKYYNPNDNDKKPGDNDNWKSIQKGFHDISEKQLETSEGLTLGKGTEDETSVTAAELEEIKNPTQLETSGALTLGKGTKDETSLTPAELSAMKQGGEDAYYVPVCSVAGSGGSIAAGAYSQPTTTQLGELNNVLTQLRNKGFKTARLFYKLTGAVANFATYAVVDAIRVQDRDGNYFPDVIQTDKTATTITLTIHNTSAEAITLNYTIVIYVAPFSKTA